MNRTRLGAAVVTVILLGAQAALAAPKVYWANDQLGKVSRCDSDGSNLEDVLSGQLTVRDVAVDAVGGKVYWTDDGWNRISRMNLDGTGIENLVTSGLQAPASIQLDVGAGKMYWADGATFKIQRADLDGSNVEDIVTGSPFSPHDFDLDLTSGKIYFSDAAPGGRGVYRANLDGSGAELLISGDPLYGGWPEGIALDPVNGKVYYTITVLVPERGIHRANLDGTNPQIVYAPNANTHHLEVDAADNRMYWTDTSQNHIYRAFMDGTGVELLADLSGPPIGNPYGIALDFGGPPTGLDTARPELAGMRLDPSAPNPSRGAVRIRYALQRPGRASLVVYDSGGRLVRRLADGPTPTGDHVVVWDGTDTAGRTVAAGTYFLRLRSGMREERRKMTVLR